MFMHLGYCWVIAWQFRNYHYDMYNSVYKYLNEHPIISGNGCVLPGNLVSTMSPSLVRHFFSEAMKQLFMSSSHTYIIIFGVMGIESSENGDFANQDEISPRKNEINPGRSGVLTNQEEYELVTALGWLMVVLIHF